MLCLGFLASSLAALKLIQHELRREDHKMLMATSEDAYGCRTLIFLASKINAAKTSLWDQLPGQGKLMSTLLLFRATAGLCLHI